MRHRPSEDILDEARGLVDAGVAEITLLGQTVNAWREPGDENRDFAWLLGRLDRIDGLERLRYTSPHPIYVTDSLVRAHGELQSLCEHVHLPVQSGSDRLLKRMGRRHDRAHFLRVVDALFEARDGLTVSTDFIVGFPGESQQDFDDTLRLVERVRFDAFFSFMYSERPGTPASRWDDDVPPEVKRERLFLLHEHGGRITAEILAGEVGRRLEVLVEGKSRMGSGQMTGRTRTNRIVNFAGPGCRPGALVGLDITEVMPHCLLGELP
jgi:tRNA-2-methylthio-N6-dimethylallyladenosine synthase